MVAIRHEDLGLKVKFKQFTWSHEIFLMTFMTFYSSTFCLLTYFALLEWLEHALSKWKAFPVIIETWPLLAPRTDLQTFHYPNISLPQHFITPNLTHLKHYPLPQTFHYPNISFTQPFITPTFHYSNLPFPRHLFSLALIFFPAFPPFSILPLFSNFPILQPSSSPYSLRHGYKKKISCKLSK